MTEKKDKSMNYLVYVLVGAVLVLLAIFLYKNYLQQPSQTTQTENIPTFENVEDSAKDDMIIEEAPTSSPSASPTEKPEVDVEVNL